MTKGRFFLSILSWLLLQEAECLSLSRGLHRLQEKQAVKCLCLFPLSRQRLCPRDGLCFSDIREKALMRFCRKNPFSEIKTPSKSILRKSFFNFYSFRKIIYPYLNIYPFIAFFTASLNFAPRSSKFLKYP